MSAPSLQAIARALGGDVSGRSVLAPAPGHSAKDRSLSVTLSATSPDGFVIYSHAGDDWQECRDHVRARLGLSPFKPGSAPRMAPPRQRRTVEETTSNNREAALRLWRQAVEPRRTPVEEYMRNRCLKLPAEAAFEAIRYHPRLWFRGKTFPAMIDPPQGGKRDRFSYGPTADGAITITPDEDVTLCFGIGEGIESTLSLRCWDCFRPSPVWSLISAGGIEKLPVLSGIATLWISVDDDKAGIDAAETVSARWIEAGRGTSKLKAKKTGADLNDAIRQRMRAL